ncbi:MAG: beta-phosphoglucomutase-like phosphatase (HAD superfamily) [Myxococcota bacterium]|jgi:beta-phosphoglucomutase-like phosphatase (HAD superfamily)
MQPLDLSRVSAIIFDCDGTLADTMGQHFVAWSTITERYGLNFPKERFFALAGVPTRDIVELLAAETGQTLDVAQVCEEREALFMARILAVGPVAPVADIAREWRGRMPMAVASGSLRAAVLATLEQLSMSDWFDAVLGAEDAQRGKPDPEIFLRAADRLSAPPARCVVYEDSDKGLEAARAAGMRGVDVRPFYTPWWPEPSVQ